jgi:hypothetical protein
MEAGLGGGLFNPFEIWLLFNASIKFKPENKRNVLFFNWGTDILWENIYLFKF